MEKAQKDLYFKGYIAGYCDGVNDAAGGRNTKIVDSDIGKLPIKVIALSTRAYNCLSRLGCTFISDIAALDDLTITTARNMGTKTAREIACWLDAHGICYSAWSKYL